MARAETGRVRGLPLLRARDSGLMDELHRRLLGRWRSLGWDGWWGDCIDVRFRLGAELVKLSGLRVLDIGCGPGVLLAEVGEDNLRVGVDDSLERLREARRVCKGGAFICSDMHNLPFRAGHFDVVVLANVIELASDRATFVAKAREVAGPAGTLLATTPNGEYWVYDGHAGLTNLAELEAIFSLEMGVGIWGYNPLPSLVFFVPRRLRRLIPYGWRHYLCMPSPALVRVPGLTRLLCWLMRWPGLRRGCKAFLISTPAHG